MTPLDTAFARYHEDSAEYAEALRVEHELEDSRALLKRDAILRLMQIENGNPLTNKNHSASSAEAVVEADAEYAGHRKTQRTAVVKRIHAETRRNIAYLHCQFLANQKEHV